MTGHLRRRIDDRWGRGAQLREMWDEEWTEQGPGLVIDGDVGGRVWIDRLGDLRLAPTRTLEALGSALDQGITSSDSGDRDVDIQTAMQCGACVLCMNM